MGKKFNNVLFLDERNCKNNVFFGIVRIMFIFWMNVILRIMFFFGIVRILFFFFR